jgi:hypothetical protein
MYIYLFKQISMLLYASPTLQKKKGAEFMKKIAQVETLCNVTLLLTAPDLYQAGLTAMDQVHAGANMFKDYPNTSLWSSCYTAMQVIVNRTTPPHRDIGGSPPLFDLLVSAGTHTKARLEFREIGLKLSYRPGTIAIVCGRVLLHEVKDWEGGERICIAHMMKDSVHNKQNVARPRWPEHSRYFSCIDND